MIRFRNQRFENYFIDPVTAVITDKNGIVQKTYLNNGYKQFKSMPVHVIQMHTHSVWGVCRRMGCSSFRWKQIKQCIRQSYVSFTQRTHEAT